MSSLIKLCKLSLYIYNNNVYIALFLEVTQSDVLHIHMKYIRHNIIIYSVVKATNNIIIYSVVYILHTHTHIYIYIYMCVCVGVCV